MAPDESSADNMQEIRRANPSGWLELTDGIGLPFVVDALLDAPPGREFNKTNLGKRAGFSRETVRRYIESLLELGVVDEVPETNPQRYRLNEDGRVTQEIFDLNSAVNAVRSGQSKNIERGTPTLNTTPLEQGSQEGTIRRMNKRTEGQFSTQTEQEA